MLKRYFHVAALSGLLALGGCANQGVSLSDYYKETSLQPADHLPTEAELNSQGRAKVVVIETDDGNLENARKSQAGTTLTRAIEETLGAGGAEVVDRSIITPKLYQELKNAEMQSVGRSDDGPSVANYAVKATITLAEYGAEFVPESSFTDKKGKTYVTPASWSHKARANISIRVYELPSLHLVKTVNGSGMISTSTSDRGSFNTAVSMIRSATQDALKDVRSEFLNLFAPRGYVIGKREDGKGKSLFKVTAGSEQGMVPGNPVVIFSEQESVNPITKKVSHDNIPIVEGAVSNIVTPNEAWVIPDDEEKAKRVRLGDQIEVKHKDSSWTVLLRKMKNVGQ